MGFPPRLLELIEHGSQSADCIVTVSTVDTKHSLLRYLAYKHDIDFKDANTAFRVIFTEHPEHKDILIKALVDRNTELSLFLRDEISKPECESYCCYNTDGEYREVNEEQIYMCGKCY